MRDTNSYSTWVQSFAVIVLVLGLASCTWIENYQTRSQVEEQIENDFAKNLMREADEILSQTSARKADYVKFIQAHTHIEIISLKRITGTEMQVNVKFHTISAEARQTILTVLKPLEGRTANAFNFTEAVSLIHAQQPSLKIESDQDLSIQVHR